MITSKRRKKIASKEDVRAHQIT